MVKAKGRRQKQEGQAFELRPALAYGLLAIVVLFFALIRIRLLNFPLERDEGEYAYAAQLILHGVAPYQLCYSMKLPGTAAAYALFLAVFGQTPAGVHLGLLLVNSATIVLVYFLAAMLFDRLAGVVAAACFALLSIDPAVLGFAGHATQFVVLPAVGGVLLLLRAIQLQRLSLFFWSGLALGLSFLMKQPGIFFFFFSLLYLLHCERKRLEGWSVAQQFGCLFAGFMLPLALTAFLLWRAHAWQKFWFWTFSYAREYGTIMTPQEGIQNFWDYGAEVVASTALIWIIAAAGIVVLLWDANTRNRSAFVLGFLAFSFAAVCPGLYFRRHYFVLLLPAAALLCGIAVSSATAMLLRSRGGRMFAAVPLLLFLLAFAASIVGQGEFFFEEDAVAACRRLYEGNPFPEALQIADFIKKHSSRADRLAVIGSEPEMYFYSERLSATGHVYTYPMMEPQPFAPIMQKEMIKEIESSHPEFLIFVNSPTSWLRKENSDSTIFSWFDTYARNGYALVGAADLFDDHTEYHWNDMAAYRPQSDNTILVFRKLAPTS